MFSTFGEIKTVNFQCFPKIWSPEEFWKIREEVRIHFHPVWMVSPFERVWTDLNGKRYTVLLVIVFDSFKESGPFGGRIRTNTIKIRSRTYWENILGPRTGEGGPKIPSQYIRDLNFYRICSDLSSEWTWFVSNCHLLKNSLVCLRLGRSQTFYMK